MTAEKNSSDSELKKIIAFIFLLLMYLSLPTMLFVFFITIILNILYFTTYYYTKNTVDVFIAIFLFALNICLIFALRFLVRWLRT